MKQYKIKSSSYAEYFGNFVDEDTIITDEDVRNIADGDSDSMSELYEMLIEQ